MARETEAFVRDLRDSENRFLWAPSLEPGLPNMLLGKRIVQMEGMPALASDALAVAFGDFRKYWVVDRLRMDIINDPFTRKNTGEIEIQVRARVGGQLGLPEAVKILQAAT